MSLPCDLSRPDPHATRRELLCDQCKDEGATRALALWCERCENAFCTDHVVTHVALSGHSVSSLPAWFTRQSEGHSEASPCRSSAIDRCSMHAQPLRYFCGQCGVTVCGDCTAIGSHVGHGKIVLVNDMVTERKGSVTKIVEDMEGCLLPRCQEGLEAVERVTCELSSRATAVKLQITAAGQRAKDTIETYVQQKLLEVDDTDVSRCRVLDRQRDELKSHAESMTHAVAF